eukprot:145552_1
MGSDVTKEQTNAKTYSNDEYKTSDISVLKKLFSDIRYCNFENVSNDLHKLMKQENDSNLINTLRSPYGKSKQLLWMSVLWNNTFVNCIKKKEFIMKLEKEFKPNFNLTNSANCNVIHDLCMNGNRIDI